MVDFTQCMRKKFGSSRLTSAVQLVLEAESLDFTDHAGPKRRRWLPSQIFVKDCQGGVRVGPELTVTLKDGVQIFLLQQRQLGLQRTRGRGVALLARGNGSVDD